MTIRTGPLYWALRTQRRRVALRWGRQKNTWGGLLGSSSRLRSLPHVTGFCASPWVASPAPDAEPERCQPRLLWLRLSKQQPFPGWENQECGQLWETGKSEDVAIVVNWTTRRDNLKDTYVLNTYHMPSPELGPTNTELNQI